MPNEPGPADGQLIHGEKVSGKEQLERAELGNLGCVSCRIRMRSHFKSLSETVGESDSLQFDTMRLH